MNILLWVLQAVLAILCISGGAFQIFKIDELSKGVAAMRELPRGFWTFMGAFGILAGLCLVVPAAIGVPPILTGFAAMAVAIQSVVIAAQYVRYGDRAPVPYVGVMTVMAVFIAYGRFMLNPL